MEDKEPATLIKQGLRDIRSGSVESGWAVLNSVFDDLSTSTKVFSSKADYYAAALFDHFRLIEQPDYAFRLSKIVIRSLLSSRDVETTSTEYVVKAMTDALTYLGLREKLVEELQQCRKARTDFGLKDRITYQITEVINKIPEQYHLDAYAHARALKKKDLSEPRLSPHEKLEKLLSRGEQNLRESLTDEALIGAISVILRDDPLILEKQESLKLRFFSCIRQAASYSEVWKIIPRIICFEKENRQRNHTDLFPLLLEVFARVEYTNTQALYYDSRDFYELFHARMNESEHVHFLTRMLISYFPCLPDDLWLSALDRLAHICKCEDTMPPSDLENVMTLYQYGLLSLELGLKISNALLNILSTKTDRKFEEMRWLYELAVRFLFEAWQAEERFQIQSQHFPADVLPFYNERMQYYTARMADLHILFERIILTAKSIKGFDAHFVNEYLGLYGIVCLESGPKETALKLHKELRKKYKTTAPGIPASVQIFEARLNLHKLQRRQVDSASKRKESFFWEQKISICLLCQHPKTNCLSQDLEFGPTVCKDCYCMMLSDDEIAMKKFAKQTEETAHLLEARGTLSLYEIETRTNLRYFEIKNTRISQSCLQILPELKVRTLRAIPISKQSSDLYLAIAFPNPSILGCLNLRTQLAPQLRVKYVVCRKESFEQKIEELFKPQNSKIKT